MCEGKVKRVHSAIRARRSPIFYMVKELITDQHTLITFRPLPFD